MRGLKGVLLTAEAAVKAIDQLVGKSPTDRIDRKIFVKLVWESLVARTEKQATNKCIVKETTCFVRTLVRTHTLYYRQDSNKRIDEGFCNRNNVLRTYLQCQHLSSLSAHQIRI